MFQTCGSNPVKMARILELPVLHQLSNRGVPRLRVRSSKEVRRAGPGVTLSVTCSASPSSADVSVSKAKKTEWFGWKNAWYPVAIEHYLDKKAPHGFTILGYDLVVWWDINSKSWCAFEDKCPHRLAPLSEGRLSDNGHIQCSYHGWTFEATGSCSGIPQARHQKVASSPLACAVVYPCMEQQGIVWVLLDETKSLESVTHKPPEFPVLKDSSFVYYWATSDVPYGYQALIENLVDPTHVPFAHHKLQGNRKDAKPVNFTVNNFDRAGFRGATGRGNVLFMPPCSFIMDILFPSEKQKDKQLQTVFMCVPVSQGRSKVFWSFPRNFARWFNVVTPMWMAHLRHMLVLDSDLYLLHLMEKKQRVDERSYTPTSADAFVNAFRRWLQLYGGGEPAYPEHVRRSLPPAVPKTQLMDRYENHVKRCPVCTRAVGVFKAAEVVLKVIAFALAVAGLGVASKARYALQLAAILVWLASKWTAYFVEKNYHFHDYNHAYVD